MQLLKYNFYHYYFTHIVDSYIIHILVYIGVYTFFLIYLHVCMYICLITITPRLFIYYNSNNNGIVTIICLPCCAVVAAFGGVDGVAVSVIVPLSLILLLS